MKPLKYLLYPPKGDSFPTYPLIIFLHGIGERGDNIELVKKWGLPRYTESGEVELPAYIAVPQCPADTRWDDVLDELDALLVQLLEKHPIDPNRVLLTGFSMGGFGTWAWALKRPEHFAAIMPVSGAGSWFGNYLKGNGLAPVKDLPIWMVHGALDKSVPVDGADEFAAALLALGTNTFGYTRYPDADHGGTSDRAFADMSLYHWLLAQKRD